MIGVYSYGFQVIEDRSAYKVKLRWVGIKSARQPNNRRPYYRMVKRLSYPIYLDKLHRTIYAHPNAIRQLERELNGRL